MVTTSNRPISVDGVRLDTLAWNITASTLVVPGRRTSDVEVPGRDGAVPSLNDNLEPATMGLSMFVMGTDADGGVPAVGRRDTMRSNLDELVHLFGTRHRLIEVTQDLGSALGVRRALAKVTDAIQPEMATHGGSGTFAVALELPYAVWEDIATRDWAGTAGTAALGATQEVTTFQGATERSQDAVLAVTGPLVDPRVTDATTGAYVTLQRPLASGETWRVNVSTWASRVGNLTLASADTAGTDVTALTRHGGTPNQAAYLPLVPVRDGGARRVKVILSGANGAAATRLSIRARRKYAV